jgi:hypothetical protein
MADPGQPTIIENGYTVGYMTEGQFRAMPEFSTYINRAGVSDTKSGVTTRANAAYPRAVLEVLVQINEALGGRLEVPGLTAIAGKSWRPGDDGAATVDNLDIATYGIQAPSHLWHLNNTLAAYLGGVAMLTNIAVDLYALVNARGGGPNTLADPARFIHGAKSFYGMRRHSAANLSGIAAIMSFSCFVLISEWNQTPDGSIIAAHMRYDGATKTGASYRLGFELGIGYTSGSATPAELCLYYRHVNGSDAEVVVFPTGGSGRTALPLGTEFCLAFKRTSTAIDFYINGLLYSSHTFGGGNSPSPGSAAEMRLLLGGDWDASRYLNGYVRNVAVWTGTQPTAGHLLDFYRVGSGFSAKGLPA